MLMRVHKKRNAFTLIELLVVIAIMAIFIALTLPAFTGMGRGANMKSALIQLRSSLSLARQRAITKHENIYMVFPDNTAALYSSPYQGEVMKAYRAYNIYSPSEGYLREWTFLPQGIAFVRDGQNGFTGAGVNTNKVVYTMSDKRVASTIGFPDTNRIVATICAITFKPDGSVVGGQPELFMSEGTVSVNTNSGTVTSADYKPSGQRLLTSIDVYNLTGQFRVRDYNQ